MTYTAICRRAGTWWEVTVPELPAGRVTQARRLSSVPATVRDLVSLMTGADPASISVRVVRESGRGRAREAQAAAALNANNATPPP